MGSQLRAKLSRCGLAVAAACFGLLSQDAAAGPTRSSAWSTEATPERPTGLGNPVLCKSFEKGAIERIGVMRTLRFGSAKPPPLLPETVNDWRKQGQMDPDAAKKYAEQEAMVKRLNGYMTANGCTPVDVDTELQRVR